MAAERRDLRLIAAGVFTVVNAWVKPILAFLSIPFIIVTLGLFYFLINVLMLYVTDWVVPDFEIDTFWWGVLAAIIVSIVNGLLGPRLHRVPVPIHPPREECVMTYLVVGVDHATLAPWHQNISARTVARAAHEAVQRAAAAGTELIVAAVIGPNSTVLPHPISTPIARVRAA